MIYPVLLGIICLSLSQAQNDNKNKNKNKNKNDNEDTSATDDEIMDSLDKFFEIPCFDSCTETIKRCDEWFGLTNTLSMEECVFARSCEGLSYNVDYGKETNTCTFCMDLSYDCPHKGIYCPWFTADPESCNAADNCRMGQNECIPADLPDVPDWDPRCNCAGRGNQHGYGIKCDPEQTFNNRQWCYVDKDSGCPEDIMHVSSKPEIQKLGLNWVYCPEKLDCRVTPNHEDCKSGPPAVCGNFKRRNSCNKAEGCLWNKDESACKRADGTADEPSSDPTTDPEDDTSSDDTTDTEDELPAKCSEYPGGQKNCTGKQSKEGPCRSVKKVCQLDTRNVDNCKQFNGNQKECKNAQKTKKSWRCKWTKATKECTWRGPQG